MTASELRIGNLVYDPFSKKYCKIDQAILCDFANGFIFIEPIPLTEEWLFKFGFEKRESSICNEWYIGKNEITHDWLFDIVWLLKPELINAPNYPFYKNGRHLIQYVHQLQNIYFALTNEELTIKSE